MSPNFEGVSAASLSGPRGITLGNDGSLYVVDTDNNRVLHFPKPVPTGNLKYLVFKNAADLYQAAGRTITPLILVQALNSTGQFMPTFSGPVTLTLTPQQNCNATLNAPITVNAVNGIASFSSIVLGGSGTYCTFNASSGTITSSQSNPFVLWDAGYHLAFTTQPGDGQPGIQLSPTPVVSLLDGANNLVPINGGIVTFALKANTGTGTVVIASNTVTAYLRNGIAQVPLIFNGEGSGYVLTATSSDNVPSAESDSFAILQPATHLGFATQPSNSISGQPLVPQPRIIALNDDNTINTLYNGQVKLTLDPTSGDPAAIVSGGDLISFVNGVAQFTNVSIDRSSPTAYVLNAVDPIGGLSSAHSDPFIVKLNTSGFH